MKTLTTLLLTLLLSGSLWADESDISEKIYLSCSCEEKKTRDREYFYFGECQTSDAKKISVILDKNNKYLSLPEDSLMPEGLIKNKEYVESERFFTRRSFCNGEFFCETYRTLNRVTLVMTDYTNWDENNKGSLNEIQSQIFYKKVYQCQVKERL